MAEESVAKLEEGRTEDSKNAFESALSSGPNDNEETRLTPKPSGESRESSARSASSRATADDGAQDDPHGQNTAEPNQHSSAISTPSKLETMKPSDFEFGEEIGVGAYSRVVKARHKSSQREYALKIMSKHFIIREKKEQDVKLERDVLNLMNHPNVIRLHCTFQDRHSLYMGFEMVTGGELFELLQEHGTLSEECSRFISAEIINALEYIHSKNVIHRDLKPENILMSAAGHVRLTDFGSATFADSRSTQLCGTAEYISPEVLNGAGAGKSSDLWALGCMIYQFFAGRVPFRGPSEYLTFQLVLKNDLVFPDRFPAQAKHLVTSLMTAKPNERLGACNESAMGDTTADSYRRLKSHEFFTGISFDSLHDRAPPQLASFVAKDVAQEQIAQLQSLQHLGSQEIVAGIEGVGVEATLSDDESQASGPSRRKGPCRDRKCTVL